MAPRRCPVCKAGRLTKRAIQERLAVCGHTFSARLSALECSACGERLLAGPGLERFELRVAVELGRAGESSGEAMRFMRKAIGLRALELAELLRVTPETVSRWETGKQPMDHRAMAVVAALVLERYDGRSAMYDTLRALLSPRRLRRSVELSLGDATAA